MIRNVILVVFTCLVLLCSAESETVNGYTWTYRINGETVEIYKGYSAAAISPSPTGAVIIPSTLGGKPVTSIGSYAFRGCSGLTSMTIPDSVTSIGADAFSGCSSLTSVTIPDSVTSIGAYTFSDCNSLISVAIPDSATGIGEGSFKGCSSLMNVTIPDSVTSIKSSVFSGCIGLINVTIPDGVTSIGSSAFSGCSGLTNVSIPDSVTSIGLDAFTGCSGLTSVTIPGNATSIGSSAFSGCSGLTNVTIVAGVTSIGGYAFKDCSSLTSMTIPDSVISIGSSAFSGCSRLEEITLPFVGARRGESGSSDSVFGYIFGSSSYTGGAETWQYYSSSSCYICYIPSNIKRVVITDDTVLAYGAFNHCSRLTSVTMPDSVTSIGYRAFSGCSSLTNVVIGNGVTSIGYETFDGCRGLTSVTIPDSVTSIGSHAFSSCSGLASVTIGDGVTSIGSYAFSGCSALASVTIGDSVTSIGSDAFYGCSGIRDVTIPQYVIDRRSIWGVFPSSYSSITNISYSSVITNIGYSAFRGCTGLMSVTIPDSVMSIGPSAFSGCSGLTSITISDSVTSIGSFAFSNCTSLTSVTIPDSVTSIASSAFYDCNSTLFDTATINQVILVDGWSVGHTGSLSLDLNLTGVRGVADSAFSNCTSLTSVTIPNSVTRIGSDAFYGCSGLMSVAISNGVTSIGYQAFSRCRGLKSVTIPDSVMGIEAYAFSRCYNLTDIVFYGDAPVIGDHAFSDVASNCCAYVRRASTGWNVDIPGTWNGIKIDYLERGVVFDACGGEGGTSGFMDIGSPIVAPTVTYAGYTFVGWSPSVDASVPSHDVSYLAQWTPNKYNVTFDANGGTGGWSRSLDYDSAIVAPTVSRTGYTFTGWSQSVAATVPLGGATYTAQWEINQYMVTFDANGGEGGMSEKQNYGTTIVAPMVTRTGYTFRGWSPNVAATVPASNVTYTAQWVINRYTVTFDVNGGTCGTDATTIDHGATVGDLPVPARVNATFLGWFTDAEGGEKVDSSLVVTKGMTLYAHWLMLEEALDVGEGIAFANSEGVNWRPVLDSSAKVGDATARSGEIGDRTNTWLSATVSGAGTMSFWCKVSCEHDDDNTFTWDRLMVYTNDVEILEWRMDGETDWTRREVSFPGGENTVKWVYFKDRSVSEGDDCAWVDGVTWTLADVAVDVGGGKSVLVPMDWIDTHSNIVMAVGGDKSVAMKSTAANGRKVWECYVLGLDPEKTSDFKITSFPLKSDGTPDLSAITFEPAQNRWNLSGATPKLKGKATLDAEWQDVPPGGDPSFRFFTVEVQMP